MIPKKDAGQTLFEAVQAVLERSELSKQDVPEVFRLCRLVLEQDGSKATYPMLALYCDWLQHNVLDRNPGAFAMLERIGVSLHQNASADPSMLINAIGQGLGVGELRQNLAGLFSAKGVATDLVDEERNWKFLIGSLFELLEKIRLSFPNDIDTNSKASGRVFYDRMRPLAFGGTQMPYMLWIVKNPPNTGIPGRPNGYYWHLALTPPRETVNYAILNGFIIPS